MNLLARIQELIKQSGDKVPNSYEKVDLDDIQSIRHHSPFLLSFYLYSLAVKLNKSTNYLNKLFNCVLKFGNQQSKQEKYWNDLKSLSKNASRMLGFYVVNDFSWSQYCDSINGESNNLSNNIVRYLEQCLKLNVFLDKIHLVCFRDKLSTDKFNDLDISKVIHYNLKNLSLLLDGH